MNIAIISASVRIGRNSHRIALFFKKYIEENKLATVELLDLMEYQFPIFEEQFNPFYSPAVAVCGLHPAPLFRF
jgi:NAD(P)H-dependent FMN reductase